MINHVTLVGRLTKDVQLKTTQKGTSVARFSLAVPKGFKKEDGVNFINCVVYSKSAENLSQFTHKGSRIAVEGAIDTYKYDNKAGQRVYVTEVLVRNIEFLDTAKDSNYARDNAASRVQQQSPAQDPFADDSDELDIDSSDLPF